MSIKRKGDDLADRLIDFAARIGKVVDSLPESRLGNMWRANWFGAVRRQRQTMLKLAEQKAHETMPINSEFA